MNNGIHLKARVRAAPAEHGNVYHKYSPGSRSLRPTAVFSEIIASGCWFCHRVASRCSSREGWGVSPLGKYTYARSQTVVELGMHRGKSQSVSRFSVVSPGGKMSLST